MAEPTLVIVESAAKAKTLEKFLGKGYKVKASVGHIKDLPKSKLGIDVENDFTPQYITIRGKGDLLKEIKEESQKVSKVLLATDPDREGEAIAWHLQNAVKLPPDARCRIEFNEITKDAVKTAIKNSRQVDIDRVNAQQARRILDRLVGYNLSPLLWSKIRKGLSAGRVQSVVVRVICEREMEINNFVPVEYWTIEAALSSDNKQQFTAKLTTVNDNKLEINNSEEKDLIEKYLKKSKLIVEKIESKEKRRKSSPPFITSTLQQEASKQLNFYSKRTMKVAQELYEGLAIGPEGTVGLITYLRTDSTRIAQEAQREALDFIRHTFGDKYAPDIPNIFSNNKGAQDAHEAIRPSSVFRLPEKVKPYLSRDQYRLYKLIWERFVASQMAPAVYDTKTVDIKAGIYGFKANSSTVKFLGYKKVYNDDKEDEIKNPIPVLKKGQQVKLIKTDSQQHFTQPPPRFTEASLVKFLEEKNIGRPSTYAPIIETIIRRYYVERQNKQFVPTELGFIVTDLLKQYFASIMEVEFTAQLEEELDQIEEGEMNWKNVIRDFYVPFEQDLNKAKQVVEKIQIKDEEAGKDCPHCGKPLLIKHGRFGKFMACSGFPDCRYTESINEDIGVACPVCGQPVVALKSKKGRQFFGCKGYPECSFRSWHKPTGEKCPECGDALVVIPVKSGQNKIACQNKECKYIPEKETDFV
ncbi:MAG TPA: type I DNA topoisomerase [Syntrophomonadaceae bacterium]|nr:type I DNA topoisomerase [Syntrophomonadaceae bacterium]HPR93085.1 type I DNA topoisomerase [Syntrophomonadaceae bacterium]